MTAFSVLSTAINTDVCAPPPLSATDTGRPWAIRPLRHADAAALKVLFRKLHAFNAALDPQFALSENWETYFDTIIEEALEDKVLCLLAYEVGTDLPCGFAMASVHHDSNMWRVHEWVEVEALYVADAWRGSGLADVLLTRACEWAESVGQSVVQLYVTASNDRAIRFYQHEGFGESQAIMRKVLA
jgi:ribosomal protein S18 acetylase RimI-like enzyme